MVPDPTTSPLALTALHIRTRTQPCTCMLTAHLCTCVSGYTDLCTFPHICLQNFAQATSPAWKAIFPTTCQKSQIKFSFFFRSPGKKNVLLPFAPGACDTAFYFYGGTIVIYALAVMPSRIPGGLRSSLCHFLLCKVLFTSRCSGWVELKLRADAKAWAGRLQLVSLGASPAWSQGMIFPGPTGVLCSQLMARGRVQSSLPR